MIKAGGSMAYYSFGKQRMPEEDWASCTDPIAMLNHLGREPGDRKCLLVVLAYFDRIWNPSAPGPIVEWARQARLVTEGRGDRAAFEASEAEASRYLSACGPGYLREGFSGWAYEAFCGLFYYAQAEADEWEPEIPPEQLPESRFQAGVIREIFGNLCRPVAIDPAWLTPGVFSIARAIDEERAFDRMPAPGEALEAADCDEPSILDPCRSETVHVPGCWLLDAILGKS